MNFFRTLIAAGIFRAGASAFAQGSNQTGNPPIHRPCSDRAGEACARRRRPEPVEARAPAATAWPNPLRSQTPAKPASAIPAATAVGQSQHGERRGTRQAAADRSARAKAIVEARAKGKFKNWDDFVAARSSPANAISAIRIKDRSDRPGDVHIVCRPRPYPGRGFRESMLDYFRRRARCSDRAAAGRQDGEICLRWRSVSVISVTSGVASPVFIAGGGYRFRKTGENQWSDGRGQTLVVDDSGRQSGHPAWKARVEKGIAAMSFRFRRPWPVGPAGGGRRLRSKIG